jgi:hypothetical protein
LVIATAWPIIFIVEWHSMRVAKCSIPKDHSESEEICTNLFLDDSKIQNSRKEHRNARTCTNGETERKKLG